MDPLTIGVIFAGLAAAGAGAYGAYNQDKQADRQLKYSQGRDALADRRQAEQDRISEDERKRQRMLQMLNRIRERKQENAAMWHPSTTQTAAMPGQQIQPAQP
jgi:hypothetical protein